MVFGFWLLRCVFGFSFGNRDVEVGEVGRLDSLKGWFVVSFFLVISRLVVGLRRGVFLGRGYFFYWF